LMLYICVYLHHVYKKDISNMYIFERMCVRKGCAVCMRNVRTKYALKSGALHVKIHLFSISPFIWLV